MTLHENLERKRREDIQSLNKAECCHLCRCASGTRSYRRFVGDEDHVSASDGDAKSSSAAPASSASAAAASIIPAPPSSLSLRPDSSEPAMRTCMCYGNVPDWPYGLRVCEMCIADDLKSCTGRIRCCGICGVVACDEDCGVELVEVTDREEWENAGCLECRGMEEFSELELFRKRPYPRGSPRVTRVCVNCMELFSLFSFGKKYQFTCRYFKCNNLLVPSNVVELKRSMTPFPLSELPEELTPSIVDFLGGKDLFSFGLVCTTMLRKIENVCEGIVMAHNHELPTGPTQMIDSDKGSARRKMIYAEGRNSGPLRPPDDGKTWVGVLNKMEALTREIYYLDFQVKNGDDGAAMRYLRTRNKLSFAAAYSKPTGANTAIVPFFETGGLMVRGGQALVTRYRWHHSSMMEEGERERNTLRSVIFSTDRVLTTGMHRVIVRYYCFCEGESLGSIGLLRQQTDGSSVSWAQQTAIVCTGRMEEHVFGVCYNADRREYQLYKKNHNTNKMEATNNGMLTQIADEPGSLCFAVAMSSGSVGIKGNQLSIRACSEGEWMAFLEHTAEKIFVPRVRGRGRRGEERLMRYLDHRARRAMHGRGRGDDDFRGMMDMLMEDELHHALEDDSDDESDYDMPLLLRRDHADIVAAAPRIPAREDD